jgi:hypothetical protein
MHKVSNDKCSKRILYNNFTSRCTVKVMKKFLWKILKKHLLSLGTWTVLQCTPKSTARTILSQMAFSCLSLSVMYSQGVRLGVGTYMRKAKALVFVR